MLILYTVNGEEEKKTELFNSVTSYLDEELVSPQ